eukprot:1219064-Prymnesium_polylepis.2
MEAKLVPRQIPIPHINAVSTAPTRPQCDFMAARGSHRGSAPTPPPRARRGQRGGCRGQRAPTAASRRARPIAARGARARTRGRPRPARSRPPRAPPTGAAA